MGFPSYRRDVALKEVMAIERRKFDREFREGAVRIVRETGRPIAQGLVVAQPLRIAVEGSPSFRHPNERAKDGLTHLPRLAHGLARCPAATASFVYHATAATATVAATTAYTAAATQEAQFSSVSALAGSGCPPPPLISPDPASAGAAGQAPSSTAG